MPTITYPQNDIARNDFLAQAVSSNRTDNEAGTRYLMSPTQESLMNLQPQFNMLVTTRTTSTGQRQQEVIEKNEALSKLRLFCSHGLTAVLHRVERNNEPVTVLANYGISSTGKFPLLSLTSELTTIADQIIAGDEKTVAMGYPPITNPTAEEIALCNEEAKRELADVSAADRVVDKAEEEVKEVRSNVDLLIRDIVADLKYTMRHSDDASRRRIMRSYGVDFVSTSSNEMMN